MPKKVIKLFRYKQLLAINARGVDIIRAVGKTRMKSNKDQRGREGMI